MPQNKPPIQPNRIKELRERDGISKCELGVLLNVGEATIMRYEAYGSHIPDVYKAILADRFGVSIAHLMCWDEPKKARKSGKADLRVA
jgi:DNA-binding transcriptional regulator YiaG